MSKAKMGAIVRYCGHEAVFVCDIWKIGNVNVVSVGEPIETVLRRDPEMLRSATHQLVDFPKPGYWKPRQGVFVVPASQVREL